MASIPAADTSRHFGLGGCDHARAGDQAATAAVGLFSAAGQSGPLCIAKQNNPPFAVLRFASAVHPQSMQVARCRPDTLSGKRIALKAAMVAVRSQKQELAMFTDTPSFRSHKYPTAQHSSPTAHVLEELQLYGYHPQQDEPDPRSLPDTDVIEGTITGLFEMLALALSDTRLEPDLDDLLWSLTDLFHRKSDRTQRQLDKNEDKQKASQIEQDGSEVRSVELERLIAEGQTILERRSTFEFMRDRAAEHYETHTGSSWRPRAGSMVNHKNLTASLIDSRDFISAKRKAETEVHLPSGSRIVFSGGVDFNDHAIIWARLDEVHSRYPDMVLLHGGTPRGADKIASCWADKRKVTQIAFKPEFKRDGKAAPFKRNDRMLEAMPIGVIVFPGSGITDNLADKARSMRLPVRDYRKSGA